MSFSFYELGFNKDYRSWGKEFALNLIEMDVKIQETGTMIHHVGIVLFLIWLLSSFDYCHPLVYFISFIYLYMVSFIYYQCICFLMLWLLFYCFGFQIDIICIGSWSLCNEIKKKGSLWRKKASQPKKGISLFHIFLSWFAYNMYFVLTILPL